MPVERLRRAPNEQEAAWIGAPQPTAAPVGGDRGVGGPKQLLNYRPVQILQVLSNCRRPAARSIELQARLRAGSDKRRVVGMDWNDMPQPGAR